MHMVLHLDSYKSLTDAFNAPRNQFAVAVVGTLFEESDTASSPAFNEIFLGTPEITHPGQCNNIRIILTQGLSHNTQGAIFINKGELLLYIYLIMYY